ncbi:MAG: response regulator [Planctomycetia bacterium]|nr:response regulator [Planctomycetia bacterium]
MPPAPTLLIGFSLPEPWGYAFVALGALAIASIAWIGVLRVRVRQQMEQIRVHFAKEAELESRLRQGQKLEAIGQLAGGIAHDFNNLLTVINGCSELLGQTLSAGHPGQDLLADIRRAGDRATALTGQLLLFSRQRPVDLVPVDLNVAIADAVRLLGRVLGETVSVETRFEPDLPSVRADIGLVHQVIVNLAVNARDAMPGGGTIRIHTDRIDDDGKVRARLSVVDTGVGMDDSIQRKIFEPFFTTKEIGQGTGLGLATVYGIVQALGGEIRFRSRLGKGTTFEIDLPAAGRTEELEAPPETMHSISADDLTPIPSRGTVLLVEDDAMVRSTARRVLTRNGFHVLSAEGVADAVRLAREAKRLDLLLTDVVMPQLSGPDVAALVRQFHPEVRLVFMSGYTPEEIARQGIELGDGRFVQKPFTAESLMEGVRIVVSKTVPDLDLDAAR